MPILSNFDNLPSDFSEDDELAASLFDLHQRPTKIIQAPVVPEEEIDLQALADEVYALMIKELKLERERLGRSRPVFIK